MAFNWDDGGDEEEKRVFTRVAHYGWLNLYFLVQPPQYNRVFPTRLSLL